MAERVVDTTEAKLKENEARLKREAEAKLKAAEASEKSEAHPKGEKQITSEQERNANRCKKSIGFFIFS